MVIERRRGSRRLRRLREVAAAGALTAPDLIASHADVVGGRTPREVDLTGIHNRRGERSRSRRRLCIAARLRRRRVGVGERTEVARGVERADLVAVARAGRQPGVLVRRARAGRLGDLREVSAASALAAPDLVAGDADVVGCGTPGEVDLVRPLDGTGERSRSRRRLRIARAADRCRHVGLDRRGRERDVVDANFVNQALEELSVDAVAADLELIRRGRDRPRLRLRTGERAVDVEAEVRAVVGEREERPCVGGERGGPKDFRIAAAKGAPAGGPAALLRGRLEVVVVVPFVDHVAPRIRDGGRVNPGLERHAGRELQGGRARDVHARASAIEGKRSPVLPCGRPGRVGEGACVAASGGVRRRRA